MVHKSSGLAYVCHSIISMDTILQLQHSRRESKRKDLKRDWVYTSPVIKKNNKQVGTNRFASKHNYLYSRLYSQHEIPRNRKLSSSSVSSGSSAPAARTSAARIAPVDELLNMNNTSADTTLYHHCYQYQQHPSEEAVLDQRCRTVSSSTSNTSLTLENNIKLTLICFK